MTKYKRVASFVISMLLVISIIPISAKTNGYIVGFDDETSIKGIEIEDELKTDLAYDSDYDSIVFNPAYRNNSFLLLDINSSAIKGKKWVKIRCFFTGSISDGAYASIDINNSELCRFDDLKTNRWLELVAEIKPVNNATKIKLYPIKNDKATWTSCNDIYIDYIGFFDTKNEADSFKEKGDTNGDIVYNPKEEKEPVNLKEDASGYIKGYSFSKFCPDENITRAEAVTILSKIIDSRSTAGKIPYSDVAEDEWYYSAVNKVYALGLLPQSNSFNGNSPMMRIDFARILAELAFVRDDVRNDFSGYSDIDEDSFDYDLLSILFNKGIMLGNADGRFMPNSGLTRAEAVAIVNRLLGIKYTEGSMPYVDVPKEHWAYGDIIAASGKFSHETVDTDDEKSTWINGIYDAYNTRGCEWEGVPMVSQAQKDLGVIGGEGGQYMSDLAVDSTGQLVLVAHDIGNFARSTDGGETFVMSGHNLMQGASRVCIDPNNSQRVIASEYHLKVEPKFVVDRGFDEFGICLSTDGGRSFDVVYTLYDPQHTTGKDCIAFDPTSYDEEIDGSAVVYYNTGISAYATEKHKTIGDYLVEKGYNEGVGLYRSDDGGQNWKFCTGELAGGQIATSYKDGSVFIAFQGVLYKSTDKGMTFTEVLADNVLDVCTISTRPDEIYAYSKKTIYVSKDNGKTFTSMESNGIQENIVSFEVSPANPDRMLASADRNNIDIPYYSHDGGKTWRECVYDNSYDFFAKQSRVCAVAFDPLDENVAYACSDWLWKSEDGGQTFHFNNNGNQGVYIVSKWIPNMFNSDLMFVGAQDFHGAFTLDKGKTWTALRPSLGDFSKATGAPHHVYGSYIVDENTMFFASASTWSGSTRDIVVTWDGGKTWETTGQVTATSETSLCFTARSNTDIWYAANMRSVDRGKTWTRFPDNINNIIAYSDVDDTLFAVGQDQWSVYKSTDTGLTWDLLFKIGPEGGRDYGIYTADYDEQNDILYFGYGGYPAKFENGKVYSYYEQFVEQFGSYWISLVAVDPNHPDVIYIGGQGTHHPAWYDKWEYKNHILRSCDGGETWQVISNKFLDDTVVKTGPLVSVEAPVSFWIDPEDGYLWVSCRGTGIWKFPPPYETSK